MNYGKCDLLHNNRLCSPKKGGNIRQTHGAAVWRPVVKRPEFCFPVVRTHAKMVGAFRVKHYGNSNPEERQEDLPPRRRKQEEKGQEGRRAASEEGEPAGPKEGVVAVQEFNLEIADKEFIVLVGPSGCGQSTTLRMVAGLEEITDGDLYIGDKRVNDVAPKDRDIAMVFQNYALYPHMTVYDNIAFALKLRKTPKAEIDRKVKEAAEILESPST